MAFILFGYVVQTDRIFKECFTTYRTEKLK